MNSTLKDKLDTFATEDLEWLHDVIIKELVNISEWYESQTIEMAASTQYLICLRLVELATDAARVAEVMAERQDSRNNEITGTNF